MGAVLIGAGEIICRKRNANIFSQGLISSGVAVLYVGAIVTYFVLNLITPEITFLLCVVITAIAFFFSQLHRSQTISAFAIIGGYIPIFTLFMQDSQSFFGSKTTLSIFVVYFASLCLFAFFVSLKNKWIVSMFIGFSLNTFATAGLTVLCQYLDFTKSMAYSGLVPLIFAAFSMVVYMVITLLNAKDDDELSITAFTLAIINSVISTISIFTITKLFFDKQIFIVPIVLTLAFAGITWFASEYLPNDSKTKSSFASIAIILSFLIIPITWGIEATALAWLIEATVILGFGISKEYDFLESVGFVTYTISAFAFLICDVLRTHSYFFAEANKYLETRAISFPVLVVSSFFILYLAIYEERGDELRFKLLNYFSFATTMGLIIYATTEIFENFRIIATSTNPEYSNSFEITNDFAKTMCICILGFALAIIIPQIESLRDKVITILSSILTVALTITTAGMLIYESYKNFSSYSYINTTVSKSVIIFNLILLIVASLASVFSVIMMLRNFSIDFSLTPQLLPILASSTFVVFLTIILTSQFNLNFDNPLISIIYLITAALWIIFGFIKRYGYLRISGLVFSIIALAKLFIIDLRGIELKWKIVSYFTFGVILIAVSFIYQYFNKKLEKEETPILMSVGETKGEDFTE